MFTLCEEAADEETGSLNPLDEEALANLELDKALADPGADDAVAADTDDRLREALLSASLEERDLVADEEAEALLPENISDPLDCALLAGALEETPDNDAADELAADEVVLWGLRIPASPSSDVLVVEAKLEPELEPEVEPEKTESDEETAEEAPELVVSDEAVEEAACEEPLLIPLLVTEADAEVMVDAPVLDEEAVFEPLSCSLKPDQGLTHGGRLLLLTLLLAEVDPGVLDDVSANEFPTPLELVVDRLCVEKPPCTGVLIGDSVVPDDVDSSDDVAGTEPNGAVDCAVELISELVLVLSLLRVVSSNPADSGSYSLRDTNCDLLDSGLVLAGPLEIPGLVERAKKICG